MAMTPTGFWTDDMEGNTLRMNQGLTQFDTAANRPASSAATKGMLYFATDTLVMSYDNGSAWVALTGTAAIQAIGVANGNVPQMNATGYPEADGSLITGIAGLRTVLSRGWDDDQKATHFGGLSLLDGVSTHAYATFTVPSDVTTLEKMIVRLNPSGTGNMRYLVDTIFFADGEAYNANTDSIAESTVALVDNVGKELSIILAATGLLSGDTIGIHFVRAGGSGSDSVGAQVFLHTMDLEWS